MGEQGVEPPKARSIWVFNLLMGVAIAAEIVFDNPALLVISAAFAIFGIGYFVRYYKRTGRNVIEDAMTAPKR